MKILLLLTAVIAGVWADHHSDHEAFKDMLEDIMESDRFRHMSEDEQLILSELILAAQDGQAALTHYIDRVSLPVVLKFIKDLSEDNAVDFEAYLSRILMAKNTRDNRQVRDLMSYLLERHEIDKVLDNMPAADKKHFQAILYATQHNTLTQFIEKEGYGPIFQILSHVDDHNDDFLDLLTRNRQVRDLMSYLLERHEIDKVLDNMPAADKKHFQAILYATQHNTLTQFIEKEGYGPIFQILSHVDDHNDDSLDLLTRHLKMEAAMATTTPSSATTV